MPSTIPSLILCGPQTIPPTAESLEQLAAYLEQSSELKPLLEAALDLPTLLEALKRRDPRLPTFPDAPWVGMTKWLSPSGSKSPLIVPESLPNTILAPLTVILHIVEYLQYLDSLRLDDAHAYIRDTVAAARKDNTNVMFQGLCIGSLTAMALGVSSTREEIGSNAVIAMRLAMCVGAYVDSERPDMTAGGSKITSDVVCITTRWDADCSREQVEDVLRRYPEAYISVELDANSVTIAALESEALSLGRDLNSKEPAPWFLDVSNALCSLTLSGSTKPTILELGPVSCIPPSLSSMPGVDIVRGSLSSLQPGYKHPENAIAIIGAACNYPGANTLDELWDIISSGQVMYSEASPGRFGHLADSSSKPGVTVSGNFISDAAQFDNGLFHISPREATYMDPQQRIALQVSYQAVESSGYFGFGFGFENAGSFADVGCYVGVGSSDHEHNVNSNKPTAYSFTGSSRSFISGRISHYFKWTGPSMTIDTACSSSGVAIHQACNAIAMGDCSVALAGGVHIMSSLPGHQNIAAAGMTASTGPCRPFDADASGYSRGEGCGFIVLKRLSTALEHNDKILGVIPATATSQSDGTYGITVPVLDSQVNLYKKALSRAGMETSDVSYVEAHGTGTPRGDPIEYRSIRNVFCSAERSHERRHKLHQGSVKSNIGHTEAASGVAGVLKVLMMFKHGQIPPQANFACLNPIIPTHDNDDIEITNRSRRWNCRFRAALVNNYGASGNNTSIVVCQPPPPATGPLRQNPSLNRYPFLISAHAQASLRRYCLALANYIEAGERSLAEIAFLVARQQHRRLRHRIVFSATSLSELQGLLRRHSKNIDAIPLQLHPTKQTKPVVLVFGGQTGSTLHFNKDVYDACYHVRQSINKCDGFLQQMGHSSLFPDIFSQSPIDEIVNLHSCLFSIQYACAVAWLTAGLSVDRVIGHSFGQLTAMCISGIITLEDALQLVVGRAELIRDHWGDEKGIMISVDIHRDGAEALAQSATTGVMEVACYNGPNNHILVGCEADIIGLERKLSLSARRLKTTHGFHSRLFNPLMSPYLNLARSIIYRTPIIPIETCSKDTSWTAFTADVVVEHSRKPVYFYDAVRRIETDIGPCIWLEAGSGSGVVTLTRQSLSLEGHTLCAMQLGKRGANALESVVDATMELWRQGTSIQSLLYHPRNMGVLSGSDLPGYQFDTRSYWLPSAVLDTTHLSQSSLCYQTNFPPGSSDGLAAMSSPRLQEYNPSSITIPVAEILHELTGLHVAELAPQATLADMGMDSIAMLELEARIESAIRIKTLGIVDLASTFETLCDRIAAQRTVAAPIESFNSISSQWPPPESGSPSSPFESDDEIQSTQTQDIEFSLRKATMQKLANILTSHLGTTDTVFPSSQLHSLGFDSLDILDLESEIHAVFGVKVSLLSLGSGMTINDLLALIPRGSVGKLQL
ncbi:hypothetical protein BDV06DRAFT_219781 [Aspergillus oleicola]